MDRLAFLYEVIENIKHVSSFDLIFNLISKRLEEHFDIKGITFFYYNNNYNRFYLGNSYKVYIEEKTFDVDGSVFLQNIVKDTSHLECTIGEKLKDDIFVENIKRGFKGECQVHSIVLKDKLAGIFVIDWSKPLDKSFLCAILDIVSIAFQRIVLSGHIMSTEEKGEHLEDIYFKEILQNKLFECFEKQKNLGFAIISVAYYDFQYQGHKTTANKEVFSRIYEEILVKMSQEDTVLKYGNDRILIISPGKNENDMKKFTLNIKKTTENHVFIEKTNFRGRIKVSYGYSSYPDNAETMKDIYENAVIMLHENIKIEGWLKMI